MSTEMLNAGTGGDGANSVSEGATSAPEINSSSAGAAPTAPGAANAAPVVPNAAEVNTTPAGQVPPAYTPNFKFKVLDKEHEIDPLFRQLMKDAETEKKIREMHEKAFGIESVKADRQTLKQKIETHYEPTVQKFQQTMKGIQQIDAMVEGGDYDNFFKALQIPEQKILEWAVKKAQLMSLPAHEQQAYNQQVQERNQLYQLQHQNAEYQEQIFQQTVQARTNELTTELSKPGNSEVVAAYDAKAGMPGAFANEVIKRGQLYAYQGKDIPVEQAVKEVLALVGHVVPPAQNQQQVPGSNGVQAQGQAPQQQAPAQKPPVIPNVGGQGTSPAKKVIRSLDDVRAISKQMAN